MDEFFIAKTPLGRVGKPTDITAAVAFAVSNGAGWVTGTTVEVSDGMIFSTLESGLARASFEFWRT